ncbi:MAG: glycosyltransferase family 2 protein [Anaerolineales bacterium]|nr:glycosyltransferase family 2 protein [Anaerolineales bacterium]
MNDTPLIAIIIVTFNAADYIEKAIRSVLEQNYANTELIIIDGGSSDGTIDIIRRYETRISRWISEPDAGVYDAMNKGVDMANGDWIYFLGADDVLVNCLHKAAPYLKNRKTIYYGDIYLPNKNKTYSGEFRWHTLAAKNINHQSIFYPRRVFSRQAFNLKYKILADYDLNVRLWGDGEFKFKYIPVLVAIHNDGGVSNQKSDEAFLADKPALISKYFGRKIAVRNIWLTARNKAGRIIRAILGRN